MSAVDFLFLPGIQKVLGQAYSQPDQAFTLNDLLTDAPGGRGTNQRHIEKLLEVGVLTEGPRRARQRAIKANTSYFLFDELRSIALKTFALKEPLMAALQPFQAQIQQAFVFGSIAKRTDSAQSDVDLVVVGNAPLLELTQALGEVEIALQRKINMSLYAPDEWAELVARDPVMKQIAEGQQIRIISNDIAS